MAKFHLTGWALLAVHYGALALLLVWRRRAKAEAALEAAAAPYEGAWEAPAAAPVTAEDVLAWQATQALAGAAAPDPTPVADPNPPSSPAPSQTDPPAPGAEQAATAIQAREEVAEQVLGNFPGSPDHNDY